MDCLAAVEDDLIGDNRMKKMKVKFHLAAGLLILTYYLILMSSDLDFMVALSDNMYYVFQVLLVLILGTIATIALSKVNIGKSGRFSFVGYLVFSFFLFLIVRVGKSNNLYLSSLPEWKYSRRSSHQFNRN